MIKRFTPTFIQELKKDIEHGYNIMFTGEHGVGKTAVPSMIFEELYGEKNKNWMYFNCSTLDVWCDLIGIPVDGGEHDGVRFQEYIRPKHFVMSDIRGIIFDEINRAGRNTQNAIMEATLSKSINGFKLSNLECVIAARNPLDPDAEENDRYLVDFMDKAQEDRFPLKYDIAYDVVDEYFIDTYGQNVGRIACDWWRQLPDVDRKKCSPRRLDMGLDYMLNARKGLIQNVINVSAVNKLEKMLESYPQDQEIINAFTRKDSAYTKKVVENTNNYPPLVKFMKKNTDYLRYFGEFLPEEKIVDLLVEEDKHFLEWTKRQRNITARGIRNKGATEEKFLAALDVAEKILEKQLDKEEVPF